MNEMYRPQNREEIIDEAIEYAKANALTSNELEALKDIEDDIMRAFVNGEIDSAEYQEKMDALNNNSGIAACNTPEEFEHSLIRLGFSDDMIEDMLEHEISHYNKAVRLGITPTFQLQFMRNENGKLSMYPSIAFDFSQISEEEARRALRVIIEAPDELSPRDKRQLG